MGPIISDSFKNNPEVSAILSSKDPSKELTIKDGKITRRDKIFSRFKKIEDPKEFNTRLSKIISDLSEDVKSRGDGVSEDLQLKNVVDDFFDKISQLPQECFNRSVLTQHTELRNYLSPELKKEKEWEDESTGIFKDVQAKLLTKLDDIESEREKIETVRLQKVEELGIKTSQIEVLKTKKAEAINNQTRKDLFPDLDAYWDEMKKIQEALDQKLTERVKIQEELKNIQREIETLEKKGGNKRLELKKLQVWHESRLIKKEIAENRFAQRLGVGTKESKGATGTKLLYRVSNKDKPVLVGVHKPSATKTPLIPRIKNWIKAHAGGQLSLLAQKEYSQPESEVAAYLVDRFWGFNIVPPSERTADGAFQLSAITHLERKHEVASPSTEEAKDAAIVLEKDQYSPEELNSFQLFAIHDFLIGNLDAHEENWFVYKINPEERNFKDIVGIDKANSMLRKNPRSSSSRAARNQYKWKTQKIARNEFSNDSLKMMRSLTPENVERSIRYIDTKLPNFLDKEMKDNYRKRAQVLYTIGIRDTFSDIKSPSDLGKYKTERKINQFISS